MIPTKLTKNPRKTDLAEYPGPSKISKIALDALKGMTKMPDTPKSSIITLEEPSILTKTSETQTKTTKLQETTKLSKKVVDVSKILINTLTIPKLVSEQNSEVPEVNTADPWHISKKGMPEKVENTSKILTNAMTMPKLVLKQDLEVPEVNLVDPLQNTEERVPLNSYFDDVCSSCLATNVPFIDVMKCSHNGFFKTYFQMNTEPVYICLNCHHMLKKIEAFRIQVNESCNLLRNCNFLESKQFELNKIKLNNFSTSTVLVSNYYSDSSIHTNIKAKSDNIESVLFDEFQEDENDIKIEPVSESENKIQPQTFFTQNTIETHKPLIRTHLSHISVIQNNKECQEKLIKPIPVTQNNTEKPIQVTQKDIKRIHVTQNNTEKHIKSIPATQKNIKRIHVTQNNTEKHIKCIPITQNNTEKPIQVTQKNIKPLLVTQNNTEKQAKLNESTILETKKKDKIYAGKIKTVILTDQELLQERHRLENEESYLKREYKCESCIRGFAHKTTLKYHRENCHPEFSDPLFTCKICKCVHSDKKKCQAHMRAHYTRFECLVCNKRSSDLRTLICHYDTVHTNTDGQLHSNRPMQYNCQQCSFTTDTYRRLRYHKQKHKDRTACNLCTKTFIDESSYRRHVINSHLPTTNIYKCDQCPSKYKQNYNLSMHKRKMHPDVKVQWYCHDCDMNYSCESNYKVHLKTSSKHVDLKFICNDCDRVFKRKLTLRQHIEWAHLKRRIHKCLKCYKFYHNKRGLTRHVQTAHLKKKLPNKTILCHYCGKCFSNKRILTNHIRTHTGERPLHCDHCEATFAHDGALYTHRQLKHKVLAQRHLAPK